MKNNHTENGTPDRCGRSGRGSALAFALLVFALAAMAFSARTEAASASLSVSATGAEVGETVDVKVTVKSDDYIGYVYVILNYDAAILQAPSSDSISGGSGTITFILGSDTADVKEASTTISFTALKAGTSALTVDSGTWGIDNNGDTLTLTTSDSSVTVSAAYTASTDATLSALKVTGTTDSGASSTISLSPSFSKNTTSYTATVEGNITTAVTTATANDSKATVSISDASLTLKTGTNTVTVKVTAESGATKTYTVKITKKEAETTQETTTEETTTEEETEETTEEETTEAVWPITVTIDGEERILLREFDETLLPEGFEMGETTWEDEVIQAGQGIYKELTLVCTSDTNGENLRLYILREDGSFLILRNYQANAVLYTILDLPDQEVPAGFQKATLVLETDYAGEDEIEAWQSIASPDYYLLYAMNWDGETGFYLYDSLEGTFQRYDLAAETAGGTTETVTEETATEESDTEEDTEATPADATPTDDGIAGGDDGEKSSLWKNIVMALEALAILLLAVALIRAKRSGRKAGRKKSGGEKREEGDPTEEETGGRRNEGRKTSREEAGGRRPEGEKPSGKETDGRWDEEKKTTGEESNGRRPEGEKPTGAERGRKDHEGFAESRSAGGSEEKATGEGVLPGGDPDEGAMSLNEYFSEFDALLDELDIDEK